jgi:ABC-type Mn2+/Zn2+ transport system ATPase subunit
MLRRPDVLLLDEPTEALDTPTAARLLAGVGAFDPSFALVIAVHDRQSPMLPWTPTARRAHAHACTLGAGIAEDRRAIQLHRASPHVTPPRV